MDVEMARILAKMTVVCSLVLVGCGKKEQTVVETFPETKAVCSQTAVPNRFIVRWKNGSTSIEHAPNREALIQELVEPRLREIDYVEQDQVVFLTEPVKTAITPLPQDAPDWGQTRIEADVAWNEGIQGQNQVVAVIDSGVDREHSQIKSQLYVNPKEVINGVDDDSNGLIDDVSGYDFAGDSNEVTDPSGHGTHVAGIIAAHHGLGPVKGVAPAAKILPLAFISENGGGNISDAIAAMEYAASQGARVINASWGGAPCSKLLLAAMQDLEQKGVLFVTAAGNYGINLESYPEYPAAYGLSGQITVGAMNSRNYSAYFSNVSYSLVHLMAPGDSIFSTYPGNETMYMNGTSMATPFVAATAALLWSARPQATLYQIREAILSAVEQGNYEVFSRGRLNVRKALEKIKETMP